MDTSYKLNIYQQNILNCIDNSNDNLIIEAKAGSGKTSTLILIANKIIEQNKKCMYLAFNKSIVQELKNKMDNPNIDIRTLHSLGYIMIKNYLYGKCGANNYNLTINDKRVNDYLTIAFNKVYRPVYIRDGFSTEIIKEDYKKFIYNTSKIINYCKFNLTDLNKDEEIKKIIIRYGLKDNVDHFIDFHKHRSILNLPTYYDVIVSTIDKMDQDFLENENNEYMISYSDMLWLPYRFNFGIPYYLYKNLDYILVDESQDLNKLEQELLYKLKNIKRNTRFIFVGDTNQAIYKFAGADSTSMDNIRRKFNTTNLALNICYRCPEYVVKLARRIVFDIDWNHDRTDKGNVQLLEEEDLMLNLKPNDVILTRLNSKALELYVHIIIDKHKHIKLKNKQLADTLYDYVENQINEYILRYNKGLNIENKLYSLIYNEEKYDKYVHDNKLEKLSNEEIIKIIKNKLLEKEKEQLKNKKLKYKNITLDYLKDCISEYKKKYIISEKKLKDLDLILSDIHLRMLENIRYTKTILYFLDYYKKLKKPNNLKSFLNYLKDFIYAKDVSEAPYISTIHMMKGSEANNIFIIDYNKFPYKFKNSTTEDLIQESNLLYVAITRAKQNLYLLYDKDKVEDIRLKEIKKELDYYLHSKDVNKDIKLKEGEN